MPTTDEHLKALTDRLDADAAALARFEDYYRGKHPLAFATPKFKSAFGSLFRTFADNWCAIVVDTVEERLNVQGFRFGDTPDADRDAWRIWQRNDMDAGAQLVHREALVAGRAYVIVWAGPDGSPRITPESPAQVTVTHAPGDPRTVTAALKRWAEPDGTAHATLFLPDRVVRLAARGHGGETVPASGWHTVEELDNPLGRVPVVEFVNRPSLLGRGESEIAAITAPQDAVNKLTADLMVASEYAAFRQRWVAGMEPVADPETGEAVEPFEGSVGRLWFAEDENTRFGEFEASDLKNYVNAIEMFVQHIASQSRTPPHYFFLRGEFPSGESIQSAEAGLVAKAKRKTVHFGDAWERVLRLAFAVAGDARADETSAETLWADVSTRTPSEFADAIAKRVALGLPRDAALADLGYSPQAIERFRQMRATEGPRDVPDTSTGDPTDETGAVA